MLMANFNEFSTELAILIITIPGSSCYTIGYRMAVISRFIFEIKYKDSPIEPDQASEEASQETAWDFIKTVRFIKYNWQAIDENFK